MTGFPESRQTTSAFSRSELLKSIFVGISSPDVLGNDQVNTKKKFLGGNSMPMAALTSSPLVLVCMITFVCFVNCGAMPKSDLTILNVLLEQYSETEEMSLALARFHFFRKAPTKLNADQLKKTTNHETELGGIVEEQQPISEKMGCKQNEWGNGATNDRVPQTTRPEKEGNAPTTFGQITLDLSKDGTENEFSFHTKPCRKTSTEPHVETC